jgi:hypothetical protein
MRSAKGKYLRWIETSALLKQMTDDGQMVHRLQQTKILVFATARFDLGVSRHPLFRLAEGAREIIDVLDVRDRKSRERGHANQGVVLPGFDVY